MKILYVDDELSKNIIDILRIFDSLIPKSVRKKLKELQNDPTGIHIENKDVKELIEQSGVIDVCYSFFDALKKLEHYENYSIFILDRNLHDDRTHSDFKEVIKSQFPSFADKDKMLDKYKFEGDFLLEYLSRKGINLSGCYFLTANSYIDTNNVISEIIAFNAFDKANILEKKKDNTHLDKLKKKVMLFKQESIIAQMQDVFQAFEIQNLGYDGEHPGQVSDDAQELKRNFLNILMDYEDLGRTRQILGQLRVMLETIFKILHRVNGEQCVSSAFAKYDGQRQDTSFYSALELLIKNDYLERDKYLYKILRNTWDVSTTEGNHNKIGDRAKRNPNKYTAKTYVYAMADILLWAKEIIQDKE